MDRLPIEARYSGALADLENGTFTHLGRCAEHWQVVYSTLARRRQGHQSRAIANGRQQLLPPMLEDIVVSVIKDQQQQGNPISSSEIREIARRVGHLPELPSAGWYQSFKNRHDDLELGRKKRTSTSQAEAAKVQPFVFGLRPACADEALEIALRITRDSSEIHATPRTKRRVVDAFAHLIRLTERNEVLKNIIRKNRETEKEELDNAQHQNLAISSIERDVSMTEASSRQEEREVIGAREHLPPQVSGELPEASVNEQIEEQQQSQEHAQARPRRRSTRNRGRIDRYG